MLRRGWRLDRNGRWLDWFEWFIALYFSAIEGQLEHLYLVVMYFALSRMEPNLAPITIFGLVI